MQKKKYEIVRYERKTQSIPYDSGDVEVYRIRALVDFNNGYGRKVKAGDLGGFVQSEENLSHEGGCWVDEEACVFGNAVVCDNAWVEYYALVYGNAKVSENAIVGKEAKVYENARVSGRTYVGGCSKIYGQASVSGTASIASYAEVYGNASCDNGSWGSGFYDGTEKGLCKH